MITKKMINVGKKIFPVFIALVWLSGCRYEHMHLPNQYPPVAVLFEYKAKNNEALPELKFAKNDKEIIVKNCRELVAHINKLELIETDNNYRAYSYYQSCIATLIYKKGKTAAVSFYDGNFSEIIYNNFDLSSFRSSIRPKLDEKIHTFFDLKYKQSGNENSVVIDRPTWRYKFSLLARGDFNNDQVEDLLVGFLDESKNASYFTDTTFILVKTKKDMLWMAEEAEKYID
ncbi:MAG: hypothetical protein L3K25_19790 [Gammaproteobacteria bacterium]|nr:hypothetical protein [Gammaproteobacteria bacterium]